MVSRFGVRVVALSCDSLGELIRAYSGLLVRVFDITFRVVVSCANSGFVVYGLAVAFV